MARLALVWKGNNRWALTAPYARHARRIGRTLTVPAGFDTDLASVPRWALPVVDDDEIAGAAVVHDYLYRTPDLAGRPRRSVADNVLRDMMTEDGIPGWKRRLVYWAVRAGGRGAWRK